MQSEERQTSTGVRIEAAPAIVSALRAPHAAPCIKRLGLVEFGPTYAAMRQFTTSRQEDTQDELWILQHPPVYTAGLACRPEHLPRASTIPLERVDRGGQITYHGPGQAVIYALLDLARRKIKIRPLVSLLEQAAIDTLAKHEITAQRSAGAPGVYVNGEKIAALGLRVRSSGCYHGIALNVDMDLAPFRAIDPCGFPGLAVTQTRDLGIPASLDDLGDELAAQIALLLAQHELGR
jgi:lipoyl(octanoyl) transferase